ncbi:tRNA (N(6)-L-threonylcarbamoyladenosine(37)-C(2))-methylthiotransferase MtaB [Desulfallas sp. Bu1-1]|uniref:tRNA (N(6)-L-threonylcarbamoyladenosine(37)-C(2))- methylthiotransferase MtaB n=1 Tax=Desulfallas sp. Bu1-1 TaxID=2787620 RepID=UPI00189DB81C|nr:tRNA (N(6)-L-threonylcarbamoyladenosine(37)-C(2))-methylthiotransferase MtaB [Desulfallas sp. Bu1-1]MBF7084028.1 tRNA (N(6)-L-threonylcarbamoyladenosine(37)-C(2))-methylthiotransferase MtaB [Desulfallas sp. Bu1-1]
MNRRKNGIIIRYSIIFQKGCFSLVPQAGESGNGELTFKVITFGCPVNQYESAAIESAMLERGFVKAKGRARINIINSCVVTGAAAAEARRVARKIKRDDPRALVVLCGCYPQVYYRELQQELPEVDIITGTRGRSALPGIISRYLKDEGSAPEVLVQEHGKNGGFEEMPPVSEYGRARPVVKIQEGCNEFCTYCIVRQARGKSRSLPAAKVLDQVRRLLEAGYREIVLAGNQLGLYGYDLGDHDLPWLIEEISNLPYDFRIRLNYVEPVNVTGRLLEVVAGNPRVCDHLYIPVQSCSDRVLKRMGRRYRAADFAAIVNRARELAPGISIWTDLIVGFPGEEESDHVTTMEIIRSLELAHLHVFPYSPRPGTPAARLADSVRPDVKRRRAEEMQELDRQLVYNYNRSMLGKELRVLVEKVELDGTDCFGEGYAGNYVRVKTLLKNNLPGGDQPGGHFVTVMVDAAHPHGVVGRQIL